MSKRATVNPRWLDGMLVQWGLYEVRRSMGSLGYPRICPMLRDGIPQPARSHEPIGITSHEHDTMTKIIGALDRKYQLVLIRAYKPWAAEECSHLLRHEFDCSERTWLRWLHDAAEIIVKQMARAA